MLQDSFQRPLRSLRLSVTDRCNLRCQYCMPEESYRWLERNEILRFEEIEKLVAVFTELGVEKLRLTGGEPLLRRDLPALIALLRKNSSLKEITLTTNGVLLAEHARELFQAGLHRLTVSLDTLREHRFREISRLESLQSVLQGIESARAAGFSPLKLDTVLIRSVNDDEIEELLSYAKEIDAELRFIEYMDVGGATRWSMDQVITQAEILQRVRSRFGEIKSFGQQGSNPAIRYQLSDGTTFGVIASVSAPFCQACDRARVTADGQWFLCLYSQQGIDLKTPLRHGDSVESLKKLIISSWNRRTDQGAQERFNLRERKALVSAESLRENPHLEMHTRGG